MTRSSIGIDLGTTHCALASAPLEGDEAQVEVFRIPQLVARDEVEARELLPSFIYFAHESDGPLALPWDAERRFAVGEYARTRGAESPARVIASAKSWLSHPGIDRRAALLPLGAPEDVEKVSPVEASFRYLDHLVEAFRAMYPDRGELGDHDVVLTVPASFDAAARDLTVEAAAAAGLDAVTLLEEPQAALYSWIEQAGEGWRSHLKAGDLVLVIDVGGGTTDFSVIAALEREGSLELHRVAVGDHILLGGDNMDLALSHVLRQKLTDEGKDIDRFQQHALTHACRAAKERLFADPSLPAVPIVVPGRGSALLGSGIRTELRRELLERILVEGFFPRTDSSARPLPRPRAALTQIGLPYAADPAITKHLASFLGRQVHATRDLPGFEPPATATLLHPTAVLFNGGVVKARVLRERLLDTLNHWLEADGAPPVRVLTGEDLDLAVARGAAYYGRVRRGRGLRIRGGTARSYYVGIESPMPAVPGVEPPVHALCVAPFGMEEGSETPLPPQELGVVVGEPVTFRFFGSSVRRDDAPGELLEDWKPGELEELAPIEITLPAENRPAGDVVPIRLQASVTPVGTLQLEAVPLSPSHPGERWKVELSVRREAATGEGR
ncbi:MAG TPA: Hsp70 family protein [Polyangiaceae bacterium]|nr:Hsp70 family protein [Polyangiaceae bacterium]